MTEEKSWVSTYIDIKGYKITATEMGDTVALALAKLLPTLVEIEKDGARAWVDRNNLNPSEKLDMDDVPEIEFGDDKSLMDVAEELGGELTRGTETGNEIEDGYNYLGIKTRKPKVAECLKGDSYEIYAASYSCDEKEIRFYNEHSQYPACYHNLSTEKGRELFADVFPNWIPKKGSDIKLKTPVLLYVAGEGETSEGNAYQNLKAATPA